MFHGYDSTAPCCGSQHEMLQHGIESPDIRRRDSLFDGALGRKTRPTH